MEPITAYRSYDGRIFERASDCADYETHCHNLSEIIRGLPKFDHTHEYDIGKAYWQHDPDTWLSIRNRLFWYIDKKWPKLNVKGLISTKGTVVEYKWMLSFLRKNCDPPTVLAFQMVGYVDNKFRQWSQPVYAKDDREGSAIRYKEKTINLDTFGLTEGDVPTVKK